MRAVLVVLVLLGLATFSMALQAVDAENVVVNGNYLEPNERAAVYKALPQTSGALKYWVVSVLQNDALRTFMPIADKDGGLVPKGVLRTNLISANYLVQRLTVLKSSVPWFVSLTTKNSLEELANAVDNEQFDIDIVAEAVSNASLKGDIAALKGKLATISGELRQAAEDVEEISGKETTALNFSIDTLGVLGLPDEYAALFERIDELKNAAAEYDNAVSQVKNDIATLNNLDASQKSQLLGLLSPLGANQTLSSALSAYANTAADNDQRVSTEYASLPTKTSAWEAELELRVVRTSAYAVLYGEDTNFKKATNFSTLENAVQVILDPANKPLFNDQSDVSKLEGAWENAENAFVKRQYATAKELGEKAKGLVKQIVNAGVNSGEADAAQQVQQQLVTGLALILGGIATILILRKAWEYMKPKQVNEE